MSSAPPSPSHSRDASNVDETPSTTPVRPDLSRSNSILNDEFGSGGQAGSNGLGNLADELADAWDDEDEDEPDMNFQEGPGEDETGTNGAEAVENSARHAEQPKSQNLSPPVNSRNSKRQGSEYDGSEYGADSDMESPGIPPALVARMDMVESLARRGTEYNGDDVVKRLLDGLKDLGAQSGVEGGAAR